MNSERQILSRLLEGCHEEYNPDKRDEDLDESGFEANGSVYKCAFGHYTKDGEPISREDYFAAKDGGSVSSGGSKETSSESPSDAPAKKEEPKKDSSPNKDTDKFIKSKNAYKQLQTEYGKRKAAGESTADLDDKMDKEYKKLHKARRDYIRSVDWDSVNFSSDTKGMSDEELESKFMGDTPVAYAVSYNSMYGYSSHMLVHPDGTVARRTSDRHGNYKYIPLEDESFEKAVKTFKDKLAKGGKGL